MRTWTLAVLLCLLTSLGALSCGGSALPGPSTSPEPSASPSDRADGGASGGTAPDATTSSPPDSTAPPDGVVIRAACDFSGTGLPLPTAYALRRAMPGEWEPCSPSLCPASDPYLHVEAAPSASAVCAHWCSGDGGVCPTTDPAYRFTWSVVTGPDGKPALELDAPGWTRTFSVRSWPTTPQRALLLTDLATAATLGLEEVAVPVN